MYIAIRTCNLRMHTHKYTFSQHFLTEFLEVGGMLTVLEVVAMKSAKEEYKEEALLLLATIANKGRQYKEVLCESYGNV